MINDNLPIGATQLTLDDIKGLIPKDISTRGQLDQFESRNIQQGLIWARLSKKNTSDILNIHFCLDLHKHMFNRVWQWAGKFRPHEVNIGKTPPHMVSISIRNLCDDAQTWIKFNAYPKDEICIRFHHHLVYIHPFQNGNGRHSRVMTDLLAEALDLPLFTWGRESNLSHSSVARMNYISALRRADAGSINSLLEFAGS